MNGIEVPNQIQFGEIFTVTNIIIYLIVLNLIGFFIMWLDKRKAKMGKWRIPEKTLFLVAIFGGSIGAIAGMYVFRHKTQKFQFVIGFPLILVLQVIVVVYLKVHGVI